MHKLLRGKCELVRRVVEAALELGFEVSQTRNNHFRFSRPGATIFYSGSPSDSRGHLNAIAQLRRASANAAGVA